MIKTTNCAPIESGKQVQQSNDIELCGCKTLQNCCIDFIRDYAKSKDKVKFVESFSTKDKFFYKITKIMPDQPPAYEVGVAKLYKKSGKCYLKRLTPFYFARTESGTLPSNGSFLDFSCYGKEYLIISQYIPTTYIEVLYEPHSVLCSENSFTPVGVNLEKNSVLARLEENIESLPITSLLNKIIKYEDDRVKFFTGNKWITLVEEKNEDTK